MTVATLTAPRVDSVCLSDAPANAAFTLARMRNGEMPLFLTANEIMQAFQPLDGDREVMYDDEGYLVDSEDDEMVWTRKYDEMKCRPDARDILEHGVRNPVSLQWNPDSVGDSGRPEVLGGHHRVALMYFEQPHRLMPVAFFEYWDDAFSSLGCLY